MTVSKAETHDVKTCRWWSENPPVSLKALCRTWRNTLEGGPVLWPIRAHALLNPEQDQRQAARHGHIWKHAKWNIAPTNGEAEDGPIRTPGKWNIGTDRTGTEDRLGVSVVGTNLNEVVIFFLLRTKYSRSFVKLRLNPWCHMDYFTDILATFLDLDHVRTLDVYGGSESSRIPSKIS